MTARIQIKRIYEAAAADDGFRVLIDRLWPRGISKERAALDAAYPDDLTALAALREYQKTAAAKKHADRGTVVVPTNKNTSDT